MPTETAAGSGVFDAAYNITTAGTYDIDITEVATGQPLVGMPSALIVAPNHAFAPFTQVYLHCVSHTCSQLAAAGAGCAAASLHIDGCFALCCVTTVYLQVLI